jgi:chromosome segregation ATPase
LANEKKRADEAEKKIKTNDNKLKEAEKKAKDHATELEKAQAKTDEMRTKAAEVCRHFAIGATVSRQEDRANP